MSLSCPFCRIVAKAAPATIVREWDDALAFVPLDPVTAGHILIIPRRHVPDAAADRETTAAVGRRRAELAAETGYCNLITSIGEPATQSVFHYHEHIVPRRHGDGLPLPWTPQHAHREPSPDTTALARELALLGPSLFVLIAPPGAGKTTLAHRHWPATAILSLDAFRGLVCDDETAQDQDVTDDAVDLLHRALEFRLQRHVSTAIDATNTRADLRRDLAARAHRHGVRAVAVILSTPLDVCLERNARRKGSRRVPEDAVRAYHAAIAASRDGLPAEGFDTVVTA